MWIHKNETFQTWRDSSTHAALWLTGGPGSGKTVMTASIIEQLQDGSRSSKPLILYYFVDGKETEKSNHLNLVPALIDQILDTKNHLIGIARKAAGTDGNVYSTLNKSTKIIHSIIKGIPEIFLFVDAIDECKVLEGVRTEEEEDAKRADLLQRLIDLRNHTTCLKLFVTSGTDSNSRIASVFDALHTPRISLNIGCMNEDIKQYLTVGLRRFKHIRHEEDKNHAKEKEIKQRIKDTILNDAAGMFLYAFMAWTTFQYCEPIWDDKSLEKRFEMLKVLAAGTDEETIKKAAGAKSNEPFTLSAFYLNIMKTLPKRGQCSTKKLFQWLVTAQSPLTLQELREAFTLKINHRSKTDMGLMGMDAFIMTLRDSCGALIKITNTVSLYHQSVKEFFLETNHEFSFTRNEAELYSSTACLTYLSFTGLGNTVLGPRSEFEMYNDDGRLMLDYPLLKYAAVYWPQHVSQVQKIPVVWDMLVSWARSGNLNVCCRIYRYNKGPGGLTMDVTLLHVLCSLGLESLVAIAFSVDVSPTWIAMVNTCDSLKRTPLHWAAANGHNGIILLLLKSGAKAEQMDSNNLTPLELALQSGNSEAVLTLIGECELKNRWLEMAVIGGHTAVVELLLKRRADVNAVSSTTEYGSALHAAAYRGDEEIVQVLLDVNANVNLFRDKFGTPLQVAAFQGNLGVVTLLLDHNADTNSKAGIHGTALQAAAQRGFLDIVEKLVASGADVRAPAGAIGTALYLASGAGHGDVVEILEILGALSGGPSVERRHSVPDPIITHRLDLTTHGMTRGDQPVMQRQVKMFRNQMQAAIISGNEKVVRCMLPFGGVYFDLAVKLGHERYIESLVDVGLTLVQNAAKSENQKILESITVAWTNALLTAITNGKVSFLERALKGCIYNLKTLIDDGKTSDAKDLITAGIEIFIQSCRVGNRDLIEIVGHGC